MKLYMFPFAPNAAKVRLYLAEKRFAGCDIEIEEEVVNLIEGKQREPEYLAVNPLGAVPALETDEGVILHESLPIIEYFEELYPTPSMFGDTPVERAKAREIERIADIGMLIGVGREAHATRSPIGYPPNEDVASYHRERWNKVAGYLEASVADGRPFLAGDRVTVADCTLQAILQFARLMELDVLADYPHLQAWSDTYREREPVKAVIVR